MTQPTDQPRYDPGAERSLLAACLLSKPAREEARRHITHRDLYHPDHEAIWDAMTRLDRHHKGVDGATIISIVGDRSMPLVTDLMTTTIGYPGHVADYAAIVRSWSIKRQLESEARGVLQRALAPTVEAAGYAASVASRFAAIRDSGITDDDFTAVTMGELLTEADDEPEWIIPGLLERRDRLMLTGEEGLGKSHWLRQFAIHAACGLHPLDPTRRIKPIRTLIFDCENTRSQVRRKSRPSVEWAERTSGRSVREHAMVDCRNRMDITRDRDIAYLHQVLDVWQPDLVVIGPLYRLVPRALQTDDEAAPVLAALDTIRDRGAAILIEAHAGHAIGRGGVRDLRPRGSSALLGWPEFGFGMRHVATGYADLVQWRGPREDRDWPDRLRRGDGFRWVPHGYNPSEPI